MYLLLLFSFSLSSLPLPDSIRLDGLIEGFIKYSYTSPARYFLDLGHYDVARAKGIAGLYLNPASLYRIDTLEVGITAHPPRSSHTGMEIGLSSNALFPFGFSIPVDVKSQELGALDFFSIGGKFKKVGIGLGIMQGDIYDLFFSGVGNFDAVINTEFDDSLTHSEIPGIPPEDTIPIRWIIKGEEVLRLMMEGEGRLIAAPFFLSIAYDLDWAGIGLGLKWTRYNIKGNFKGGFEQTISNLDMLIEGRPSDWTVALQVEGKGEIDSIWTNDSWGEFSTAQPSLSLGAQFDLNDFIVGLTMEHYFHSHLRGDYAYLTTIPTALRLPEITYAITSIDTVEKRISGKVEADFGIWDKNRNSSEGNALLSLPSQTALRLGVSAKLPLLFISSSLGMHIIGLADGVGEFYFNTGMEYLSNPPIRMGFIVNWKLYQIGYVKFSPLPIIGMGIGTSYPINRFSIDLALRIGSTPLPLIIDPLTSLSIGCGVRYSL